MTDRMLFSGKREVTPGILADADHILFKARYFEPLRKPIDSFLDSIN